MEPEETSIAKQQLGKQVSPANRYESNNRGIVGNDVSYSVHAKWL
jgi:hypothetical protein